MPVIASSTREEGIEANTAGLAGAAGELQEGQAEATVEISTLRTARKIRGNGEDVEPPKNGQVNQQIRRLPLRAVAPPRTTSGGFSHSHSFGLRDSQSSPKTHPKSSSESPTPNSYHDNSPNDSNSPASSATARKRKAATRTAWELPELVQPLHRRRTRCVKQPRRLSHYPAVVEFVYNHRYATTFQIQRRFNDYMRNQRTSQYQLASLVDLGYLQRAPVRSTSPNFPAVYAATRQGIGLVKESYASLGIAWTGTATEQLKSSGVALESILHEVLLTEFDEAVRATVESRGDRVLLMYERRYFHNKKLLAYDFEGKIHRLIPDAGFLLRLQSSAGRGSEVSSQRLQLNFVEFDNGTLSTARLATKYEAYDKWSKSEIGRTYLRRLYERYGSNQGVSFRLLIVARHQSGDSDESRLALLLALALFLPRPMRERIWLTTAAEFQSHQDYDPPLAVPMWVRVRDCRNWLPTVRELSPDGMQRSRLTTFVARHLPSVPRHPLLPLSQLRE